MAMTAEQIQAAIDSIDQQLNSAMYRMSEGGRSFDRDLKFLSQRREILQASLDAVNGAASTKVRRILTYPAGKGL